MTLKDEVEGIVRFEMDEIVRDSLDKAERGTQRIMARLGPLLDGVEKPTVGSMDFDEFYQEPAAPPSPCGECQKLREEVEHWRTKATCYGNIVHGCTPALEKAGFPVETFAKDGAVGSIKRALEAMGADLEAAKARWEKCRPHLAGLAKRRSFQDGGAVADYCLTQMSGVTHVDGKPFVAHPVAEAEKPAMQVTEHIKESVELAMDSINGCVRLLDAMRTYNFIGDEAQQKTMRGLEHASNMIRAMKREMDADLAQGEKP